ncbi:MAG TPA: acyclic terpene utilization AtuA family protein [Actinomycetes bacterium]|nr:acyclic terpene utilization AtuA family protein [Actinomycetes bacterium]
MEPLRIANCSGFYGDRRSAPRELLEGGPIDVLTGDYLAELTMLILWRSRGRDPAKGYATSFLAQMEECLGLAVDRGVKVVANAGGLNPAGLAAELRALAGRLGIDVNVAHVEGDDLLGRLGELQAEGEQLAHLDTGTPLAEAGVAPVTANAYLGAWGIVAALEAGADVVVCGRVTDASLVVGPAAWHFGWAADDWDRLAGAVAAGHVLECGTQATGGNYAFLRELPDARPPGFPIAEVAADGSAVVTKHPGTGGLVSVGTVTAQLLYEIAGPAYANPDVVARFDTVRVEGAGADRVRLSGTRGEPAPDRLKVAINYLGGFRNSMSFVLTGLDIEAKAAMAEAALFERLGGRERFQSAETRLVGRPSPDPAPAEEAGAELRITVTDPDPGRVGRSFSSVAIELALASYPGCYTTTPPTDATPYGVYWPALVRADLVDHTVVLDNGHHLQIKRVPGPAHPRPPASTPPAEAPPANHSADPSAGPPPHSPAGHAGTPPSGGWGPYREGSRSPEAGGPVVHSPPTPTTRVPFGAVFGARSGDKGGNANVGIWARDERAYRFLAGFLTVERFRELIPEARRLPVQRYELPNLLAVNFVVVGLLGEGVSSSTRVDPQAKGLGEWLRARVVELPVELLERRGG